MKVVCVVLVLAVALGLLLVPVGVMTPPASSQGVDVFLNATQSGSKKFNIAIPEFGRVGAADAGNFSRVLPEIIGNDLRFSNLFQVVANEPPLPEDAAALQKRLADFAAAGAHGAMHGYMAVQGQRVTVDFRLYDLTNPSFRQIATKSFWAEPLQNHRGLAHRISDEIVYQFTGERGIAETKIAYVTKAGQNKELAMMDYDGFNQQPLTRLQSISLSPVWSPRDPVLAFTSFYQGYPFLYQISPFNQRQTAPSVISAWPGINSAASWAPDGRSVALTLSYQGNPEIYSFRLGTVQFPAPDEPSRDRHRRHLVADGTGDRLHLRPQRGGAGLGDGRRGGESAPAHHRQLRHPAQVVPARRHDPLHAARRRGIRHLGHLAGRRERAPAHQRPGREQERVVGPERPPHRLRVVAWRTAAALHDADGRIRAATPHPRPRRGAEPDVVATASVRHSTSRGRKERGMNRRRWQTSLMVVLLFGASVLLTGCPKKPAPAAGTGPGGAGPGAAGAGGTGPGSMGAGGGAGSPGSGPGAAARPAVPGARARSGADPAGR